MAEDIGIEPCFDMEDPPKPRKEALKKMKKAERSAPIKEEVKEVEEKKEEDNGEEKPMSKTQKRKLKIKLAIERKEKAERGETEPEEAKFTEEGEPEAKKAKSDKPQHMGKDRKYSFEAIEKKFSALLGKLSETTSNFKEGEAIIKKDVEDGKITTEEAHTLYRVYNRNLRIKRLREKLNRTLGEGAPLEAVKEKINDWRAAGKVTVADATILVKRWKTRETRRVGRQEQKITGSACFHCREPGHRLADCPKRNSSHSDGVCFKCGSMEHSIHECKKKGVKGFPFATCFVCKQVGHISRDCHQNLNGVYPDGGACNVCGAVGHLKRDCPELAAQKAGGAFNQKKHFTARAATNWNTQSADADYDPTENSGGASASNDSGFKKTAPAAPKKTAKHIKF